MKSGLIHKYRQIKNSIHKRHKYRCRCLFVECDVTSNDFADTNPKFIQTGKQQDSHVFDVDGSSVVVVGNELIVDVNAVNTPLNGQLDESSNIVEVVSEDGEAGGEDDGSAEDGSAEILNFDINLTRIGISPPAFGADFIGGEDTIEAAIEVTNGEIVGEPTVRWYITADHFPKNRPNTWNNGDLPEG